MTHYIALLRAVNVGGTGKLPMAALKSMCEEAGLAKVRTYIASGNVVFESRLSASKVKALLEARLQAHAGKPVGVLVRTQEEMEAVVGANPFAERPANRTMALFLDGAPSNDEIVKATHRADEEIVLGKREIYLFYPDGMGQSKLVLPSMKRGTARNLNTVARLAAMAALR